MNGLAGQLKRATCARSCGIGCINSTPRMELTMTMRKARLNMAEILDQHLLPRVEKPSRYLGNEVNSVGRDQKDPREVRVRGDQDPS